ncbi:hypothetical protein RJT34_32323 [Clitoria ternatea]|uniref:ATP citrate synthase n=2 Tax=Magnoliopsida TaxID=3398 RepID=A0AAN9I267_CLITE
MNPLNLTSNQFFFIFTLTILYVAYTFPRPHPKQTNLVFYVHDHFTGDDSTAATVAGKSGPTSSILHFGTVAIVDDPVTVGSSIDSTLIGRAQGIYVNSQLDGKGLYMVFSVIFTDGEFKGSSLEIQGSDIFTMKEREFGVVSGTGYFRFVKGYGIMETQFMDIANLTATLKLNVTARNACSSSPQPPLPPLALATSHLPCFQFRFGQRRIQKLSLSSSTHPKFPHFPFHFIPLNRVLSVSLSLIRRSPLLFQFPLIVLGNPISLSVVRTTTFTISLLLKNYIQSCNRNCDRDLAADYNPSSGGFISQCFFNRSICIFIMAAGQLFSRTTQALFYNYKQLPIQRMLDFDFLCGRETPSVAGIINPGSEGFQKLFFGQQEIAIPVHAAIEVACAAHPTADVFINFASFRSAAASSMAALKQPTIRVVAIIAEGVPESDTKQLIAYARANNKVVIGPATVGGIQAGAFRIGDTAGTIDNIIHCKLYRPGSVGFVSKSGGMSNELYNTIARVTDGIYEGIAIGGDVFPGSTLSDHVLRFNNIPQVKMMVVLGELGGHDEYSLVKAIKEGKVTKPVVAWVSGTCARLFKSEVQFGHAGAKSGGEMESAQAKNQALSEAGAVVPTSFEAFEAAIKEAFDKLVREGKITPVKELTPPPIPEDLNIAILSGKVRAPTHIISTISDDRGEEPCYAGVPMSSIIEKGLGVGDVISLLWFKRSLPRYCTQFIEMCIMLCADHGPCVSGAHNSIVTARAGKDLVSCLVSGLLTIGPRFGGAIDDAARYFKDAYDRSLTPYEFVESMKKKGIRVPGIGHRIKNRDNKDKRVELLQKFARTHFPSVKYMEYAVEVEDYTLTKANNLVLNVDGAIGSLFLDLLAGSGMFTKQEIDEIVEIGYLNGLFVLARSIGLIGHTFDQKRLKQPLYRHPWEDVLYTK